VSTRSVAVAPRQRSAQLEADDLRHEHRKLLAEHRRLGLDAAGTPAEHAEPVDHRRVRVGADEGVREREPVARLDDAREELEVHLVADTGVRRDDGKVVEPRLAQRRNAYRSLLRSNSSSTLREIARRDANFVDLQPSGRSRARPDLRIDLPGVSALVAHRVAHRGEIHDARDAREVLQAARGPGANEISRDGSSAAIRGDRVDLGVRAVAQHVLEQDPERVREPRDVPFGLERVEPEDRIRRLADSELLRLGHATIQAEGDEYEPD